RRPVRMIRLLDANVQIPPRAPKQRAVLDEIIQLDRMLREQDHDLVRVSDLSQVIDVASGTLDALVEKGAIEIVEVPARDVPEPRAAIAPTLNPAQAAAWVTLERRLDRKSTRLNSSHEKITYADNWFKKIDRCIHLN